MSSDRSDSPTVEELRNEVTARMMGRPTAAALAHLTDFGVWSELSKALDARLAHLASEHQQLREALNDARAQLRYVWQRDGACPCGARMSSPHSHAHVTGCPTAAALAE